MRKQPRRTSRFSQVFALLALTTITGLALTATSAGAAGVRFGFVDTVASWFGGGATVNVVAEPQPTPESEAPSAGSPVAMSSQPGLSYTENFADIANWTNNFATGIGTGPFSSVAVATAGTIPDPGTTTIATTIFNTGTSGGVQRGSSTGNPAGTIVLLATGATSNTNASAFDFSMNYSGVNAGTLSFDWTRVNNSTGDRGGSLRVYSSPDGTTFTELATAAVNNIINNGGTASGSITTVALPATFNNSATARLRFYYFNGTTTGTTGSRPKISIDNLTVTATRAPVVS